MINLELQYGSVSMFGIKPGLKDYIIIREGYYHTTGNKYSLYDGQYTVAPNFLMWWNDD